MKLIQRLHSKSYSFDKVLMLGYGGGSAAQIIHEKFQNDSQIVGVESDATIYDWAQRYFYSKGVKSYWRMRLIMRGEQWKMNGITI